MPMIVVSTITSDTLDPATSGTRFSSVASFVALLLARRILDFGFLGGARLAAFLRVGLTLALPRFRKILFRFQCHLAEEVGFEPTIWFPVRARSSELLGRPSCSSALDSKYKSL
jgi:hypothetical protein